MHTTTFLFALTLWCQFFTGEIERDPGFAYAYRLEATGENHGQPEVVRIEDATLDEWKEVLCDDTVYFEGSPRIPGLRVLDDTRRQRTTRSLGQGGS